MPFEFEPALFGGAAIDAHRRAAARGHARSSAGAPTRCCSAPSAARSGRDPNAKVRPEQGLLQLRKALGAVRQSAPRGAAPGGARRLAASRRELLHGRRYHGGARADRRHLFRRQAAHRDRGGRRLPLHRRRRSSAWCASRRGSRARAAASSPRSTRPTCSRPRACGARWSSA